MKFKNKFIYSFSSKHLYYQIAPLSFAILSDQFEIFKLLLERPDIQINIQYIFNQNNL